MAKIHVEKCTRCERTETYRWHGKKTDSPVCNTCHAKEWRGKNPETYKERCRVQNNSKNSVEARKKYLASDKWKARKREWEREQYWKNPEAAKAKKAKYKNLDYYREYYSKNKAAYHERTVRRTKDLNKSKLNNTYTEEIIEIYANCPEGYEVDHIVPLKGKDFREGNREHVVCGLHVPWNLQYLPRRENRSKGCNLYSTIGKPEEI